MRRMLAVRDALSKFYGEHDTFLGLIFKFALASAVFFAIRKALGQMAILNSPALLLALAGVCTFLPSNAIIIAGMGLLMGHFYGISLETAIVGGGILLIAVLLYFSMAPESAYPLILSSLCTGMGIGCAPAVFFGLVGGPLSAFGAAFGALACYLVRTASETGGNLTATASEAAEAMMQRMAAMMDAIFSNKEMFVVMAALAAALLVVYLIRIRALKYAWLVGAAAGILTYALIRGLASARLGLEVSAPGMAAELGISFLTALISQLMLFQLDYKKTETVRFEDDDYFYYVKAVPKTKIRRKKRKRRSEGRQG